MTERLYYHDSKLLQFDARIVAIEIQSGKHVTSLDRSAFYPASGGQLFDLGTLNGVEVVEVVESPQGSVWHVTLKPVGTVGSPVRGDVDAERRRRHCQQHTAQHILSQSFIKICSLETVSVHLGEEYGAIELEGNTPTDDGLKRAESLANDTILRNAPVDILLLETPEAEKLPLRKIPDRTRLVRVIKIDEFDWSACGGTHCQSTAEVGMVKIIGYERLRGHTLVKFLCGVQLLSDYSARLCVTDGLSRLLTCHYDDLEAKINKLLVEGKEARKIISDLQKEVLPLRAERLSQSCRNVGAARVVSSVVTEQDMSVANSLAQMTADQIGGLCVLVAGARLVIATSSGSTLHAGQLAKHLASVFGLKGGGNKRIAQVGGAVAARLDEYVNAIGPFLEHA